MAAPVPSAFIDRYMALDDMQRMKFDSLYQSEAKSPDVGLICAILGVYFFYMGQVGKGIAFVVSCFFIVGGVWWIITMINAKKEIAAHNESVALKVFTGLR